MKKIIIFVTLLFVVFFVSCNQEKNTKPTVATATDSLSSCFEEIASFTIAVKPQSGNLYERLKKSGDFYLINYAIIGNAKNEKTVYGYKRVHICKIKKTSESWKLNKFILSKGGHFLTIEDIVSLYEQVGPQIPIYTWIMTGDYYSQSSACIHLLDHPGDAKGFGECLIFSTPEANYRWRENVFSIVYWDDPK